MKRTAIPALALLAACATLRGGIDSAAVYRQGLDAFARRDFATASIRLQQASTAGSSEIRQRSTVLLAAASIDPANPVRQMSATDGLSARLAAGDGSATFEQVIAETLGRMADEVETLKGALAAAQMQRDAAYRTIDSQRVEMDSLTVQRDAARRRTAQLEQSSAEMSKELEKKTQEIERILRAIRR